MASMRLSWISTGRRLPGFSVSSTKNSTFGSIPLNSSSTSAFWQATISFKAATLVFGKAITTSALNGMALRILPPSQRASRASSSVTALRTRRTISLLALARPSLISRPECPPRSPFRVTLTAASWSLTTSLYSKVDVMSTPPAEPMTNFPHVSESRFMRMSLCSSPPGISLTPNIPVSSSRVISASTAPCFRLLSSMTAMMAATPTPSSAPSVVLSAYTHPSTIWVVIGSVSKL